MLKIYGTIAAVCSDRKGATAIEYGLISALLSILLIAGLTVAGPALETLLTDIGTISQNAGG